KGGGSASGHFNSGDARTRVRFLANTFELNAGVAITGPGIAVINGATVRANAAVSVSNLDLVQGTWTGAALTVTGRLHWTGGTMSGASETVLATGALGLIDGDADKVLDSRTLTVSRSGHLIWRGSGNIHLANTAEIDVHARGVLDINNSSSITGSGQVRFNGTVRRNAQ